jgi:hypothetical protein
MQLSEGRSKKPARQTLNRFQYLLYHKNTSFVTRRPSLGLSEQALDSTLCVVIGGEL